MISYAAIITAILINSCVLIVGCVPEKSILVPELNIETYEQAKAGQRNCTPEINEAERTGEEIAWMKLVACERYNKKYWEGRFQVLDAQIKAYMQAMKEIR